MGILLERNQSRFRRVSLGLLAVASAGILVIQGCTPSSQSIISDGQEATVGVNVGELAPDFTLVDLDGNQVSLSDFRGKTVFVNFWATWCPPCRAEMPEIEAVYQEHKDKGVVVIGVNILVSEILRGYDENDVLQYVQQGGYSWTFVLDTTGEVAASYNITAIPTIFFIDKDGIIQAVNIGAMSKRAMESKLAEAMR
jgi:thiol-disulfide isomerase/thioredoxin